MFIPNKTVKKIRAASAALRYMQLVTPSVVATAVRTDITSWITIFQVSFFMIIIDLSPRSQREVNFAIEDWILKIEPKVTDRVDAVDEVGASV